jgi:hypothetical protein
MLSPDSPRGPNLFRAIGSSLAGRQSHSTFFQSRVSLDVTEDFGVRLEEGLTGLQGGEDDPQGAEEQPPCGELR